MRQVIRGKAYDTETATEIARGDHGEDGEFCWLPSLLDSFSNSGGRFF